MCTLKRICRKSIAKSYITQIELDLEVRRSFQPSMLGGFIASSSIPQNMVFSNIILHNCVSMSVLIAEIIASAFSQ